VGGKALHFRLHCLYVGAGAAAGWHWLRHQLWAAGTELHHSDHLPPLLLLLLLLLCVRVGRMALLLRKGHFLGGLQLLTTIAAADDAGFVGAH
jgi:hypothetical protein